MALNEGNRNGEAFGEYLWRHNLYPALRDKSESVFSSEKNCQNDNQFDYRNLSNHSTYQRSNLKHNQYDSFPNETVVTFGPEVSSDSGISDLSSQKQTTRNGTYPEPGDGKMVLQLVLPENEPRDENGENNNNYLSATSSTEFFGQYKNWRIPRRSSISRGLQDIYTGSTSRYVYENRAFCNNEIKYSTPSSIPERTTMDGSISEVHEASTPDEKKTVFRDNLTIVLSCVYAVFIITVGIVIYVSDMIVGYSSLPESFSIYLLVVGFAYQFYLITDIRRYQNKQQQSRNQNHDGIEFQEFSEGDMHLSIPHSMAWDPSHQEEKMSSPPAPHDYCFTTGRHSGSFYLKLGAAGFCLGHLIHNCVLLAYQVVFLTSDSYHNCANIPTLVLDVIYPVYSFILLYFIFKYSNVIINRHKELARFALMHCIASSLCFWVWTILRETMDSLSEGYDEDEDYDDGFEFDSDVSDDSESEAHGVPIALPLTTYNKRGARIFLRFFNKSANVFPETCKVDSELTGIYNSLSPYLYPFTVEFSILVVGVLFIIWQNIGSCKTAKSGHFDHHRACQTQRPSEENGFQSNLVVHADCHSANRGLFAGIIILVIAIVSIILFFIAIHDDILIGAGLFINMVTECIFLSCMTVSAFFAYRQITKLDVNHHSISLLDDLLLFICIPGFFLNAIFSIPPSLYYSNQYDKFAVANTVLQVIQVLIQTPFISDGLRRCSNSKQLRIQKPGRELITFLIVCNVAMWITSTFEIKTHDLQDNRYDYYGPVFWTIFGHLTLPLMMFYRFHSSVCLVDIWKSAYEPTEH